MPATPAAQALTCEMAAQAMEAAAAEARQNKWNVTMVVTDAAGIPVMRRRMNGGASAIK